MILKKPYAFLIKNFRKIHFILAILSVFIIIKTNTIVTFFKDYIANNYTVAVTDTLVKDTISNWLYVSIILTIIALILIYILLKTKKKPRKFYLFSIIYYMILLTFIIIASILISSLTRGLWDTASARIYRDFANMIFYPSFIFPIITFIRSLGFNIKQFNFKSDLKKLEITDKDSEEIELSLNFDNYKAKRTIRRFIREFKYYYEENKKIFYLIGIILIIISGFLIYKNTEKTKYTYSENKTFTSNSLIYKITDSMITNLDLKGNTISNDNYYVVIKFEVKNSSNKDLRINYDNFKLYYGKKYVYPSLNLGNNFLDFGDPYMNDYIKVNENKTYIMAYEIDKKYKNSNFKIVLYLGTSTKSNDFLAKTATIKLNPVIYDKVERIRNASINDLVSLSGTSLKNSSINIKSVLITNRYEYQYDCGYKTDRYKCTDFVVADSSYQNKVSLIVMDYDLTLDNTTSSYQNINDLNAFASNFMKIEYSLLGKTKVANVKYKNPSRTINKLILETDGEINDADVINLLITIRNREYAIRLK